MAAMPDTSTLLSFLGVSLLLGLSPGPDNLFVLTQAATHGRRAGLLVVLGLCTGLVVHTAAVALGLSAVFAASATTFVVLKVVGALYLAVLAWQAWRAAAALQTHDLGAANDTAAPVAIRPLQLYARGVVMNLTNPKVVLFFLAFLPQFVQPQRGTVPLQLAALGGVFIVSTLVAFGGITWFAAWVGTHLRRSVRAQQHLQRATAVVLGGLAVRLALSQR